MSAMVSRITDVSIVHSTVRSRNKLKGISKLRVSGLSEGISLVTGEFQAQRASNAENVFIWWRHHVLFTLVRQFGATSKELSNKIFHQNASLLNDWFASSIFFVSFYTKWMIYKCVSCVCYFSSLSQIHVVFLYVSPVINSLALGRFDWNFS